MSERSAGRNDDGVREIRRYANRKLYDTAESAFTTLAAVEELVRSGTDVRVIDHASGDDLTEIVLARVLGSMLRASGAGLSSVLGSMLRAPSEIARAGARSIAGREESAEPTAPAPPAAEGSEPTEVEQLRSQVADLTALVERLLEERDAPRGDHG